MIQPESTELVNNIANTNITDHRSYMDTRIIDPPKAGHKNEEKTLIKMNVQIWEEGCALDVFCFINQCLDTSMRIDVKNCIYDHI